MGDCQSISEMIPEYIGGNTTRKQNFEIAGHLASCAECRADFALWLSVDRSLRQSANHKPSLDFQSIAIRCADSMRICDKPPNEETDLQKIINSGSYTMAFDLIRYAFSTIKTTYRLASLL